MNRLEKTVLTAFLFWTGAGLIFTLLRLTPALAANWPLPGLSSFVAFCLRTGDPVLIVLAFAQTHLLAARVWGAPAARTWALRIFCLSGVLETIGTLTGFPFGSYTYTDQFGPLLGVIPLTIPLAWQVILTNAFLLVTALLPETSFPLRLTVSALLCCAYDFSLEPFATQVKHYWVWQGGVIPIQNYLAWLVLSVVMLGLFVPRDRAFVPRLWLRPALTLGGTLLLFWCGYLAHRL